MCPTCWTKVDASDQRNESEAREPGALNAPTRSVIIVAPQAPQGASS